MTWSGRAALGLTLLVAAVLYARGRRRLGAPWPMRRTAAAAWRGCRRRRAAVLVAWAASRVAAHMGGVAARGPEAIRRYGGVTCHTIPGIVGAVGSVGPPLTQVVRAQLRR